ncbi:hypothetical protein M569_11213 [Genlisea aurea]|uniref:diacylglycerol O-acyltransferase n=1 Tax=Genlisea aurea TaxID=192259 RepID=S8DUI8_9LAMI|nr:hypothetical protein M569_11213 [Genlisea aurea]
MEFPAAGEEEEEEEAVSPSGEYLKSSKLDLTILGVLEFQNPIDDSPTLLLIDRVFLPINPRFSSIMVADETGAKKWKRVRVNLQDHVKVPVFPADMRAEYYDGCFREYLTSIAAEPLPQDRPLWEIHVVKYPTKVAAGNLVFKIHHSLGDGYSLMGALLSCLQRLDDPLMPLTFPSRKSTAVTHDGARRIHLLRRARR